MRWQYDTQLNLVEIETAGGTIHQYQNHDARGNPATVILAAGEPEERIITYTYHPEMNVPLTRSEPSVLGSGDKITIWDYDDDYDTTANENPTNLPARVIEQGFTKDGTGATIPYEYVTTLTYNTNGQLLTVDGPLAGTADTTQFGYAAATGNLLSITRPLVGSTSFANYDAAGQVGRVTDVNNQSEAISYDGRGRITGATHEADASTTTVSYNTAGLPDSATDEDDISKSYEYNANGRLYRLYDADGNYLEYLYDTQGNLIERAKHDAGNARTGRKRWTYQHSTLPGKLYKEIKADDGYAQYGYDGEGNLSAVTDFNGNTTSYGYDALSRVITDIDSKTYVYNQNNRLVRVEEGLDILGQYTYNGLGQRQLKEVAGVATVFHYDFDGNTIAESLSDGTMTVEYLQVDQSRMAMVTVATGVLYFFHNNYLGTPVLMTDTTSTVVWEADYKPFGEAGVNPNSAVVNNFRFAGQYFDAETRLHYNWHRYYDPKTGRYLTPDPIGLLGGINLYSYAGNNSINATDPFGLEYSRYNTTPYDTDYGGGIGGFSPAPQPLQIYYPESEQFSEEWQLCEIPTFRRTLLGVASRIRYISKSIRAIFVPKSVGNLFKHGQTFERTIQTSKGPVDVMAETVIKGKTLHLKNIAIFGRDSKPLTGLSREFFKAKTALIKEAKAAGFQKLRITGVRHPTASTSASPGKFVDMTIELLK